MPKRSRRLPTDPDHLATISDERTGQNREVEVPSSKDRSKPPADPILAAHSILAQITGEEPRLLRKEKDEAAVSLGRRGGLKGGKARAKALTPEQRKVSALKAAHARWHKAKSKE